MVGLAEKVNLGEDGEISLVNGVIKQIRTNYKRLDVSTAMLPDGEYETMILQFSGRRVDIPVRRDPDIASALRTHFNFGGIALSLVRGMPRNPNIDLICSGKLEADYPGQWVAILDGKVVNHDSELETLTTQNYGERQPILHYFPSC